MWWPGSSAKGEDEGDNDESPGGGSTPTSDFMEILSEEDIFEGAAAATSSPLEIPTSVEDAELRDLKEQFAEQENLLGQLKGVLRSNEEKLQSKEKDVQDYASRLARARLHSQAKDVRLRSLETSLETRSESITTSTPTAAAVPVSGKMKLLKMQLDELRQKEEEERQQNRDLENLVKDLQLEVNQRDKEIQRLKEEGFSVASYAGGSPPSSPFVMSPGGGSPSSRSPPLGRSYDSVASYEGAFRSFNAGFAEKDEKILDLQEKNIELERRVMDLEDSLRAKEELVRARTEAVTLLTADLSQKGRVTLDQLEDTRAEMRAMQEQFARKEAEFKEKASLAEVDAAARERRFRNTEQDVSRLDRVRFELCAKNAALQEKVVGLQSELQGARRASAEEGDRFDEERTDMRARIEELEKELRIARQARDERDRQLIAEVTDVAVEYGGGENFGQMIVKLENKMAELEEEKGNLQLKVVELEESNGKEK